MSKLITVEVCAVSAKGNHVMAKQLAMNCNVGSNDFAQANTAKVNPWVKLPEAMIGKLKVGQTFEMPDTYHLEQGRDEDGELSFFEGTNDPVYFVKF